MRRFAIPSLVAVILFSLISTPAQAYAMPAPTSPPTSQTYDWSVYAPNGILDDSKIAADSAILIDARTGTVLYSKDPDERRYPASTTKIMTCLLALENCKNLSTQVTVGKLPDIDFRSDSDRIGLQKGEVITMENLLYSLMVKSANDAADAIAQYIGGGDINKFYDMMNQKAQDLGMTGTHYKDANGLADDTDHYTTASDMAKLARAALLEFPTEFAKLVKTTTFTLPTDNKRTKTTDLTTTNWMLKNSVQSDKKNHYYQYATGIKTGYTSMAQNALVASAKYGDVSLISVVMHDPMPRGNIFDDSKLLFEYGFNYFGTIDLLKLLDNEPFSMDVKNAATDDPGTGKLDLQLEPQTTKAYLTDRSDVIDAIKADPMSALSPQVSYTKDSAPIKSGDTVGTVTFSNNGVQVFVCNLIASRDVAEMPTPAPSPSALANASAGNAQASGASPGATTGNTAKSGGSGTLLVIVLIVVALIALALVTIRFINLQRRNKRYRQYNYRASGGTRMRR